MAQQFSRGACRKIQESGQSCECTEYFEALLTNNYMCGCCAHHQNYHEPKVIHHSVETVIFLDLNL